MDKNYLMNVVLIGTTTLIFIAIGVIGFVVIYQRKIFAKSSRIAQLETENQKELVNAVILAKEMEQKRIAQELHDEIGSSINSIKMSLIGMPLPEDIKSNLTEDLLQISKNVRRISNELMPSILEELGFHQAIKHLVKKFQTATKMKMEVIIELEDPYPLEKQVELSLYRVLQELINNVVKYANATEMVLTIHHTSNNIDINLIDNGNGFVPDQDNLTKGDSLGLKNIKSRIQQIEGHEEYSILEPKGTKVHIHLKKK
jgi:signal transduction histidine kinase